MIMGAASAGRFAADILIEFATGLAGRTYRHTPLYEHTYIQRIAFLGAIWRAAVWRMLSIERQE